MVTTIPTDAPQDRGSEQSIEQKAVAGLSQGALVRRRFFRHAGAMVALVVLVLVIILAFSSVGTVIGGTGKLQASGDGTLSINGFRIPGWWPLDWFTSYPLVNGGQPTLTLFPFSLGEHTFEVRCFDGAGAAQIEDRAPPHPSGATGIHSVTRKV